MKQGTSVSNIKINIETALGRTVSNEALYLCITIIKNSVTCDIPYANTEASKAFTLIAGTYTTKDHTKRKGYHIHDKDTESNVFGSGYIGQSISLGTRVRQHANNHFQTTSNYITSLR